MNYLFPLKNSNTFIDAGVNLTRANIDGRPFKSSVRGMENYVNFIPSIGYRKHTTKDVMWRVSITPVANKFAFTPWLGFSVGKRL